MFVMTEDTESASQIANKLNTDPLYKELNGKTVNLHTRLKGKLKPHGRGENIWYEFIENLHSTTKCNKRKSDFVWCFKPQTFSGAVIYQSFDLSDVLI